MNIAKLILVLLAFCNFEPAIAADNDLYKIKQGDTVFISVYGEETLQKELRVLPDGSVTFPLAGRVDVLNSTTAEVENKITTKLKEFLPEPQVTVVVTNSEGNKIYLVGKVLKPGPILLSGPTNALQALSYAGGFDKFAELNKIKVIRTVEGITTILLVNYEALTKGKDLNTNVRLQAGDVIVIP